MLLIISICAVSAEDVNQTDDNLKIDDTYVISTGESTVGSFADLSQEVGQSTAELDIKTDYKFNSTTDGQFTKGIEIVVGDDFLYTINGNNHVIDADNQAGVFKFINGTVIINNLKITNSKMSSIVLVNCIQITWSLKITMTIARERQYMLQKANITAAMINS